MQARRVDSVAKRESRLWTGLSLRIASIARPAWQLAGNHLEKCFHQVWIKLFSTLTFDFINCIAGAPGIFIGTHGRQGVKDISHGHNASSDRDGFALQPDITGSI